MLVALYFVVVLSLGLFLVGGIRLLKLARPVDEAGSIVPEIDPHCYQPMERLLREDDFQFLAAQGFDQRGIRRIRAERRGIFRKYLKTLRADFNRIAHSVRVAMVESSEPRPDLAKALFRARLRFTWSMVRVHMRLSLQAAGVSGLSIDVRPLVASLERVREQWDLLGSLAAPSAA